MALLVAVIINVFHTCQRHCELPLTRTKVDVRSRLHSIEGKMFRFSILGVFTGTNWAPEELLKRTKFQVCVSIIFDDFDMAIT